MAYQSDWIAGTVSVTNGSTAVTGVGTVWNGAGLSEGDTLIINNLVGVISTVNNALSITLAQPWQGASATNVAYRARYMSDGARYTAVAKQVLQDLQAGNVSALAGLTGAANKIPMFTGPGAMSLLDAGTTGKAVLAAATQDAAAFAGGFTSFVGGVNFNGNRVRTGWHTNGVGMIAQVDALQLGYVWTDHYITSNASTARSLLGAFASAGGTISGGVTAGSLTSQGGVTGTEIFSVTGATFDGVMRFQTGTIGGTVFNRWAWVKKGFGVGEPGSNQGSNLGLFRWADDNTFLGESVTVSRRYGTVELRETTLSDMTPGSGQVTLTPGMHIGALGASNGFNFNRGANGGAFTIGGNPGSGGRAVHVPLSAWYKITVSAVAHSPGAASVFGLGLNGTSWIALYSPSSSWASLSRTVVSYLNANAYLTWCGIIANTNLSLENSSITIEFVQF